MPVQFRRRDNLKWTEAEQKVGEAIRSGFAPLGQRLVAFIRARAPQDTRKFWRSVGYSVSGRGLATKMIIRAGSANAEWVEKGREPGKAPPIDVILAWVRRRGLGALAFSMKTRRAISTGVRRTRQRSTGKLRTRSQSLVQVQRGIAFVIARKIGRVGLPNPDSPSTIGYGFFKNLKRDQGALIATSIVRIRDRVANLLNEVR